jgi:AcrR family transcriptional regulator
MARKKASEQGDTQQDILDAAFALFGRYGYDGVSMGAIARQADITKAALYWHYKGKSEIYVGCLERLYAVITERVFAHMAQAGSPGESLFALFVGAGEMLHDPRIEGGVAGYWLEATTADLDEALQVQQAFEAQALDGLTRTIQSAIDGGELSLGVPVEEMARAVIAIIEAIILPLKRQPRARTEALVRALAYTFFSAHEAGEGGLAQRALAIGA